MPRCWVQQLLTVMKFTLAPSLPRPPLLGDMEGGGGGGVLLPPDVTLVTRMMSGPWALHRHGLLSLGTQGASAFPG